MSSEKNKACCSGGCAGHCGSGCGDSNETGFASIVEMEIHYSETEGKEEEPYVFKSLYCLTNIQTRESRVTGLEGKTYQDLDEMRQLIMAYLLSNDDFSCCSLKSINFSYIKDDI